MQRQGKPDGRGQGQAQQVPTVLCTAYLWLFAFLALSSPIPSHQRSEYLDALVSYLSGFYERTQPLAQLQRTLAKVRGRRRSAVKAWGGAGSARQGRTCDGPGGTCRLRRQDAEAPAAHPCHVGSRWVTGRAAMGLFNGRAGQGRRSGVGLWGRPVQGLWARGPSPCAFAELEWAGRAGATGSK